VSKAFTSEETPDPVPPIREPPRVRPGEIRYVTPEGQAALRAELERLRAAGAPSEEERSRRALLLERTLALLTVLGPDRVPEGEVGFGTWVTVEDEEGHQATWRIVGPDEADARQGSVSALSPLGRALVGRSVGESVEVERPGGKREYTILRVHRSRPEAP
jgi:transcription elongation factor GreB